MTRKLPPTRCCEHCINNNAQDPSQLLSSAPQPIQTAYTPCTIPYISHPTKHTIPASHGFAAALKAGSSFRLIDLHGTQVIDMSAFVLPFPDHSPTSIGSISSAEHLSPSHTLFHTRGQPLAPTEHIYTNLSRPLFRLSHDTVRTHDMTFMSCYPSLFDDPAHRSCAANMLESFTPWGMRHLSEVRGPFNVFQNTPNWSLKPLGTSKAGDWVQFEVLLDCVVGWSCCPFDLDGFNGGCVTDVMVVMGLAGDEARGNDVVLAECAEWMRVERPGVESDGREPGVGEATAAEREVETIPGSDDDDDDGSSEWSAEIVAGRIAKLWRRSFLSSSDD